MTDEQHTFERESMDMDVVIVGAGPAGLAAAIRLKQLALQHSQELSVCVLEKGAAPGDHILSGAVMDVRSMNELLPDWKNSGAPIQVEVTEDQFWFLTKRKGWDLPGFMLPPCFRNEGNYVVSLAQVVRWLAQQAEALGIDVFPGFAATEIVRNAQGAVTGVITGDVGIDKQGNRTTEFQPGMILNAKYTLIAEGARGQLAQSLIRMFSLDAKSDPQSYAMGLKEIWEIDSQQHQPGLVIHQAGWPLDSQTYGGGFLYHLSDNQIAVGLVVGLDYRNPWLSPFEEFQRFKTHPRLAKVLKGGQRLAYGARAITAGGLSSLPELIFPGGALLGCSAGFLNASRIKGSHGALKTGMLAAEAVFKAISDARAHDLLQDYVTAFKSSWLHEELNKARNFKQWFKYGRLAGTLMTGVEQALLRGHIPWTLHRHKADHECLQSAAQSPVINYPRPDGKLSFDRLSSVYLSNTHHAENQPSHLRLKNPAVPQQVNWPHYAGPEERYCPAGVYEYVKRDETPDAEPSLQINASNCVHCKSCDIKDPTQNIVWVAPEGGGGPRYPNM